MQTRDMLKSKEEFGQEIYENENGNLYYLLRDDLIKDTDGYFIRFAHKYFIADSGEVRNL